ncbi:conserved hypothetical protein [Paraburkholderia ribeironis]|uniref:Uncharacterized protein n=1 Tax=Paraburkholderia ribeironis TaxID=1247936 RepID=A0A1N7SGT3_9BURK|nr:conserved hypothetical protein [Paraburkholderia ribeironis]
MLTLSELAKIGEEFPKEIERMTRCLKDAGRVALESEVAFAWARYSDSVCAKWLSLPADDETLTNTLVTYLPAADPVPRGALCIALRDAGDNTGSLLVELPSVLVTRLGWKTGNRLSIDEDPQGGLILRRL